MEIGSVAALYRYPVKSLLGESVETSPFNSAGMVSDRAFALRDKQTGHLVSAKRPQLWRAALQASARVEHSVVTIALPNRSLVRSDDPVAGAVLSQFLRREVELLEQRAPDATIERAVPEEVVLDGEDASASFIANPIGLGAPAGGFFDFAPVYIITRTSLRAIEEGTSIGQLETRFRPNIVINDENGPAFVENGWIGRRIRIGSTELSVIFPTPRCAVPTLRHGSLGSAPHLLRAVAQGNSVDVPTMGRQPCLGVYAQIAVAGDITRGDAAVLC